MQHGRTSKTQVNPTQVHLQKGHPIPYVHNEFNNPVEWDPCPLILLGLSSFRAEAEIENCLGPAERALAAAELWTKLGNALRSRTEDIPTYR